MTWWDPEPIPPDGDTWEAKVSKVVGGRPYVTIPRRLDGGREYGPCRVLDGFWTASRVTGAASAGTAHTHSMTTPTALAKGDEVLVAFLEGHRDRVVVIGRFAI